MVGLSRSKNELDSPVFHKVYKQIETLLLGSLLLTNTFYVNGQRHHFSEFLETSGTFELVLNLSLGRRTIKATSRQLPMKELKFLKALRVTVANFLVQTTLSRSHWLQAPTIIHHTHNGGFYRKAIKASALYLLFEQRFCDAATMRPRG